MENSNEKEINLLDLLMVIKANLGKIIILGVIVAVLAFTYSAMFMSPVYKSSGKMVIKVISSEQITTFNDIQIAGGLVNDCMAVIKSRKVMQKVVDELGLDCTADSLMDKVSVSSPAESRVIQISATAPDPVLAQQIASAVCVVVEKDVGNLVGADSIKTFEDPEIPNAPSSPNIPKNTLLGAFVGAFIMAAFVIVVNMLNNKIYTEDDVNNMVGLTVFAAIPYNVNSDEDVILKKKEKNDKKHKNAKKGEVQNV